MAKLNVDQSDWGCVRVSGADRVRFLQGMCTANIETLGGEGWVRAAFLNPKGRVLSIADVVARNDCLLLFCEPGLAQKTRDLLDRYVVADDVQLATVDDLPLSRAWGEPPTVWAAPPVLAPAPEPVATAEEVEARRVEAGLVRYGVDVDESCFPFESGLAATIDYEKGCYIGQEPVARVKAQGKPSRTLVGLRLDGEGAVERGAPVSSAVRAQAGQVTSSVRSPVYGPIALAYLHRMAAEPGAEVEVAGRRAVVTELPFR